MTTTSPRLRVAYFVPPSPVFAGIERVVHDTATCLAENYGDVLDVHVVFASHYDERALDNTAYCKHVLGIDRLRTLAVALRRLFRREGFEVVVCPQVEPSVVLWTAVRRLSVRVFVTHLHGNPKVEENGSLRSRAAFAVFRHVVSRRITAVFAVSPSLARYAASAAASAVPVQYVPNPVRQLVGTRLPPADEVVRLVCVARLSRQKGQDLLLEALALARTRLPPVELTLVGSGPDEAALRASVDRLGLEDVVTFAGYVTDPTPHLLRADLFVLASRWEGFGNALVEALSLGLPLLATDCDFGPADIISDARIGDVVPDGDVEALAEALLRAVRRPWSEEDAEHRRAVARTWSLESATAVHQQALARVSRRSGVRHAQVVEMPPATSEGGPDVDGKGTP